MIPKPSSFDVLILDFDGTLTKILPIDWTQLKKEIDELCRRAGVNSMLKPHLSDKLNLAFSCSDKLKEQIIKLIISYEEFVINQVRANKKILDILRSSLKKKQEVYILSNNTSYLINYFLNSYRVSVHRKNILSLDKNSFAKPHATIIKTLSRYCKAKKVLYIGNSSIDKELANQLGFKYADKRNVN